MTCERVSLRSPETTHAMAACLAQVDRMADMIQALLQLGRLDCGQANIRFEPVAIAGLIETVTNDLEPIAEKKQLAFDLDGRGAGVWLCDEFWMQEAVSNILKNCIEHAEKGTISIRYLSASGKNQIVIRDHGEGIAEGYEAKLFDRYFFGDRANKESNGLGLSIAAKVLQLHFGAIHAKNREDGGAEFCLSFPQLDQDQLYRRK